MFAIIKLFFRGGVFAVSTARDREIEKRSYRLLTFIAESEISFQAMQFCAAGECGDVVSQTRFRGRAEGALRVWLDATDAPVRQRDEARLRELFDHLTTQEQEAVGEERSALVLDAVVGAV